MSIEHPNTSPETDPQDKYNLLGGRTIIANQEMSFLGVKKGDALPIHFDGTYLAVGPLTWSVAKLTDEIDKGIWTLQENS